MAESEKTLTRRGFLGFVAGSAASIGLVRCASTDAPAIDGSGLSFGVVADAQYCDCEPKGSRHYRASLEKLAACVQDFNKQDLAFVIHLGDFIDDDFASFDALLPVYDTLAMPHFHVLGNHDFSVAEGSKGAVPVKLGMRARYYDFSLDAYRFIVLDGNDVSLYANPEGSKKHAQAVARLEELTEEKAPNGQPWNGAVGAAQLAWLESTLASARAAGQKAIIFCHFPVFPANVHNLWNDSEVIDIIEASGQVVAYINGHNHHGNHAVKKGVHYLTVQGMVETPGQNAYASVTVRPGGLVIDGRGREPDRVLRFRGDS